MLPVSGAVQFIATLHKPNAPKIHTSRALPCCQCRALYNSLPHCTNRMRRRSILLEHFHVASVGRCTIHCHIAQTECAEDPYFSSTSMLPVSGAVQFIATLHKPNA